MLSCARCHAIDAMVSQRTPVPIALPSETEREPVGDACNDRAMIEIRTTAPEEYRAASAVVSTALMHAPANDEDWAKSLPSWEASDSLGAWDGDRCVGHAAGFRFDTLVPGGARVATSGVSRVGVLGTYRRQGILRRLMTRLLEESAARGQVLASLRASETLIYQRYGYGLAGEAAEVTVVPAEALPITGAAGGSMRLLAPDRIIETVATIYERVAARPGVITRPDWMWARYFENAVELGGEAEFVAVHTSPDGIDDGFVHYSVKWKTERFTPPAGEGEVFDLWGAAPSVELALWHYICSIDLVRQWFGEERPVDEVARLAVADRRGYRSKWHWDEQWLRLVDVDAALTARSYAEVAGPVAIAVTDELLPHNCGVWEISSAGAKRTGTESGQADLVVDVGALAAVYLGGTKWSSLAAAGRLGRSNPGSLAIADALFTVADAPFCGSGF